METENQKIWLVTGVSSGFGKALMTAISEKGDIAVGTVRKKEQLVLTESINPGKTFAYLLDVNNSKQVSEVIDNIKTKFGKIDIVVNNAGYGLIGAVEETSEQEARQQIETNVFGALSVTQKALPIMREQGNGHFFQISSIGGLVSYPGAGIYNASKYALEGFSEAIAKEARHLGIKVTIVEPGPFRTEWAGTSMKQTKNRIAAYNTTVGEFRNWLEADNGSQVGDPYLAAKAMVTLAHSNNPPLNFPVGEMAINDAREKINRLQQEIDKWESLSVNTAFNE
ncbi:SDR family NAD(P)-dependent oxidoreductase [Aquimarina sp. U1-2]|uniref:oxidoreductase n=1 Tax=Aquimarina sp. U1-2 TaxID=2823141 RepID=UPI001AECEC33|nr:oxidoreductase [Aquimarina sp. U1-2]MBP2831051.1 SDR family NAD(P)-dependent oxidoreductase [Aquimarina sp. U1-2]